MDYLIKVYEIFTNLFNTIKTSETFQATILGAFLASIFGLITQACINTQKRKKRTKKYAKLLYYNYSRVFMHLRLMRSFLKESIENSSTDVFFNIYLLQEWKLEGCSHWEEYLAEISEKLPGTHIKKIRDVYILVNRIRVALINKDSKELLELLNAFFKAERGRKSKLIDLPIFNVTAKELEEDLLTLSTQGKVKDRSFIYSYKEFIFKRQFKKISGEIENSVVEILKAEPNYSLSTNEIIERLNEALNKKDNKFNKKYNENWERLIFNTLLNATKFDLVWGEVSLNSNENN